MVAYNFQAQFVEAVQSKEKRQTIRALGKRRHAEKGDALQLYTGQRTTSCRLLLEAICYINQPVVILPKDRIILIRLQKYNSYMWYAVEDMDNFAKLDGFNSAVEFFEFFGRDGREIFRGCLIKW